jgi:hypothetical protein
MARATDPKTIAQRQSHLKNQPRSGLTVEKYCQREGIVTGTFYAWKRRFKAREFAPARRRRKSSRKPERPQRGRSKTISGFVQVPLPISPRIEVRFANGTLLSLPPGNLEALSTTLRTLQATQLEGVVND